LSCHGHLPPLPPSWGLLQLSDGQICGDCDLSGEYDGSILFCDKCQEVSEAQDATHDCVVVFKQLTLGKLESDGELQLSNYRPDEIGALVLLCVGLFPDVDDHEVSLTLCDCLCFIMDKGIDHCPSCVSEATALRLATKSGVPRG